MLTRRFVDIILVLGLTWLFTACFAGNILQLGSPYNPSQWRANVFETFQTGPGNSEMSVTLMLDLTKRNGLMSTGGLMMRQNPNDPPYFSAWGLQGKVFSLAYAVTTLPLTVFVERAHMAVSLVFALMLASLVIFARREWGLISAITLTAGVCMSPWLVFAGRNLYLVYFLHLLPFVLSMICFPWVLRYRRFTFTHFVLVVSSAVLVKSLCFFDYSSNIVLSTAAGPIYFGIKENKSFRQICQWVFIVLMASALVVVASILATCIQAGFWLGSLKEGFDQLMSAAGSRMYSSAQSGRAAPPSVSVLQIFDQYLTVPALNLPFDIGQPYRIYLSFFSALVVCIPLSMTAWLDGERFPRVRRERTVFLALAAVSLWGMLATLSWAFLMKGHMSHHIHMNGMIFYIPYMLLLYILLGKCLSMFLGTLTDRITGTKLVEQKSQGNPIAEPPLQKKQSKKR